MFDVALSLGTNSGDLQENMCRMVDLVCGLLLPPILMSPLMETEPVDVDDVQPWYLNRVIAGNYCSGAFTLLDSCKEIEWNLGRREKGTRRQRTADIDILLFGNEIIDTENLTVPHPAIFLRRFCLEGLNRIKPDIIIGEPPARICDWYHTMNQEVRAQKLRFLDSEGGRSDN